jgi:hypothetical protein
MADIDIDTPEAITSLSSLVSYITATSTSSALLADTTGFLNDTLQSNGTLSGIEAGLENGISPGNPVVSQREVYLLSLLGADDL